MLRHKSIDRICCIVLTATLALTGLFMGAAASGLIEGDSSRGYENRLFDQSRVHTIDIVMDDWESFLETCVSEEYAPCTVVIDGEAFGNVAIRAKGNTSLSSVASYGNDRYSFKIEFDHYENGKTYYGLDKLSLNNLIQDKTFMKDYLAYTLMGKMGVSSPLCSFVQINVNGEAWGFYLAVEAVEDSFLTRNYGSDHGELYKPDSLSMGGGRGNGRDFDMDAFGEMFSESNEEEGESSESASDASSVSRQKGMGRMNMGSRASGIAESDQTAQQPAGEALDEAGTAGGDTANDAVAGRVDPSQMMNGGFDPGQMTGESLDLSQMTSGEFDPGELFGEDEERSSMTGGLGRGEMSGGGMGGGMGSSDVMLQYVDDDPSSYSNIFSSAKTDVSEADQERLIEALRKLSEGEDMEEILSAVDAEAVIRYLVVHNFMVNDDSYTGTMIHNYYLYEEDGALSMIPWDYNLAFGGFNMGGSSSGATSAVNSPIDSPVSSGDISSRPILAWIFESEEYAALYHEIYQEFVDTFFTSGWLDQEIQRVSDMIAPYVEADENGFFTYDEFLTASETLREFCALRGESIAGQLSGSVPSTTEAQRADSAALVDASHVDLSDLGEFGMGGGRGGMNQFGEIDSSVRGRMSSGQSDASVQNDGTAGTDSTPEAGGTVMPNGMTPPEGFDPSTMGAVPAGQAPGTAGQAAQPGASEMTPEATAGQEGGEQPQATAEAGTGMQPEASDQPEGGSADAETDPAGGTRGGMPDMNGMSGAGETESQRWILLAVSAAALLAGILAVKFMKSGR